MATPHDYCAALAELAQADADIKHMAAQLRSFTDRMLAFPQETCFAAVAGEPSPPLGELIGGAHWHVEDFPTPERLQAALRRRFLAREKALKLWDQLAPHQRDGAPRAPA